MSNTTEEKGAAANMEVVKEEEKEILQLLVDRDVVRQQSEELSAIKAEAAAQKEQPVDGDDGKLAVGKGLVMEQVNTVTVAPGSSSKTIKGKEDQQKAGDSPLPVGKLRSIVPGPPDLNVADTMRPRLPPGAHALGPRASLRNSATRSRPEAASQGTGNIQPHHHDGLIEAHAVEEMEDSNVIHAHAKPLEWWTPRKITLLAIGGFLAIGLIVAVITAVVLKQQEDDSPDKQTLPTLPPEERWQVIQDVLIQEAYSPLLNKMPAHELFENTTAPQYQALQWLAWEDPYKVPATDHSHLIQRYALAVLYYSTGGADTWVDTFEFLQWDHECSWSGALQCATVFKEDREMQTVTGITLQENGLINAIPSELNFLTGLELLDLGRNNLGGALPPALSQLTHLDLNRNAFTGSIPASYTSMTDLTLLHLQLNQLNGTFPEEFGSLTKLTSLDLEANLLTGTLPESIWDLTNMQVFILDTQWEVAGTISPKVGLWTNATMFLVNVLNGLTGSIPSELGLLTNLVELKTAQNHMRGTIPTELGQLTNIEALAFSRNGYNGTFPTEFAQLTKLRQAYIQATWLTGDLDVFCAAVDEGDIPLINLVADQMEVNCTCCTCCLY